MKKVNTIHWLKVVSYLMLAVGCFYVSFAFAKDTGVGQIADNIRGALRQFARLMTALSYLSGLGFSITSIFQFKAHKDNPSSTPLSKPVVLMFVAVGLLFLPTLFSQAGTTVFGISKTPGNISGISGISGK